jgi:hypothetical protein
VASKKKKKELVKPAQQQLGPMIEVDPTDESYGFVRRRGGKVVTLPLDYIQSGQARIDGYNIATADEAAEAQLEKRAGTFGQTALGLVEAPVRGATFGLYDAAAIGAGADPDMLRQRKKQTGLVGDILEITGAVAPAFATGGGGGIAQLLARGGTAAAAKTAAQTGMAQVAKKGIGAALRHTPAGLAARAGRAVEPKLARLLTTKGAAQSPGLLARSAASGIVGAGEAALYGVGEGLSEAAHLGDYSLAGELIMANMGGNALMGGTAAGAFTLGLGAIGRGVTKAATQARNAVYKSKLSPGAEAVSDAYAKAKAAGEISQDVQSKLEVQIDNTTQAAEVKGLKAQWDNLRQLEKAHVEGKGIRDNLIDETTAVMQDNDRIMTAFRDKVQMKNKILYFQDAMKTSPPANIKAVNKYAIDLAQDLLEKAEVIRDLPGNLPGTKTHLDKYLLKPAMQAKGHIDDLTNLSKIKNPAEAAGAAMGIVDDLKRRLGRAKKKHVRGELKGTPAENALEDLYEDIRLKLEDPDIWGIESANAQRELNRSHFEDITLSRAKGALLNESFPREKKAWSDIYLADRKKVGRAVEMAHRSHIENSSQVLLESLGTEEALVNNLLKYAKGLDPEATKLVDKFNKNTQRIREIMGEASELNTKMDKWQEGIRGSENLPFIVGAGRNMVIKAAASANAMSRMTALAESTANASAKVKNAVKATIQKGQEATRRVREGVPEVKRVAPLAPVIADDEDNLKKKYDKAVQQDKEYQENASLLQNRVIDFSQGMSDIAPNTTFALMDTAARAAEFMRSKRPEPPLRASDVTAHLTDRQRVSDSQMAKYLRYREGLDPMDAMDKLAKGQISREGAETLREVYPNMFSMVEREMVNGLASAEEPLPVKDLMNLSILLDRPLHPSFEPAFVAAVQKVHNKAREDRKPPVTRKAPDMAEDHASRSQQLA